MRALSLALAGLVLLFALGCPASEPEKPVPTNTPAGGAGGTEPADPAVTETGGGAETTQPGGLNADEAAKAAAASEKSVVFQESLEMITIAMEQDIALAKEHEAAQAKAMEKIGGAMSAEVAEREKQLLIMAEAIVTDLKAKGFDVMADIVTIEKDKLPPPAKSLIDPLQVGDITKIVKWQEGHGIIRKMSETETTVTLGYIYVREGDAQAVVNEDGSTTTVTGDGTTSTIPAGGE